MERSPASSDIADVLRRINDRHGTSWSLVGRLPGGYLRGAYQLRGARSEVAVLKWHAGDLTAARLAAAARNVALLRSRGWPTPRWLAHGSVRADGGGYVVEEFVGGHVPAQLTAEGLQQLLRANRLQADLEPETEQDWSSYVHRVVFDGEADLVHRMRARPITAALLIRLEQLASDARSWRLPVTDLVHGDFVLRNMITADGSHLQIVDAAHIGKGTRAYDLATLLLETTVEDRWADSATDLRQLEQECLSIVGPTGLRLCLVGRMLHLLVFGEDWRAHDPTDLVARCAAFIARYERP